MATIPSSPSKPIAPPMSSVPSSSGTTLRRQYQIFIDRPPQAVFDFFAARKNAARITPAPCDEVLGGSDAPMGLGTQLTLRTRRTGGTQLKTLTVEVTTWNPPHGFGEKQIVGPFTHWAHQRKFAAFQTGTLLTETIEYIPQSGTHLVGVLTDKVYLGKRLDEWFHHRHKEAKRLLEQVGRIKGR